MSLEPEDVQEVLALLDSLDVDEMHLRTARFALTVRRGPGGWVVSQQVQARPDGQAEDGGDAAEAPARPASTAAGPGASHLHEVCAPLVGTFYRAPQPGAEPFIDVGSRVEEATVVGIVETMKLMNPVLAGAAGTVVEICLPDATFAEQDEVLMRIDPRPA